MSIPPPLPPPPPPPPQAPRQSSHRPLILALGGKAPRLHPSAFVAPGACLIGDVELGEGASVWFNAVLRGDGNKIVLGPRTNVQDGCVVHADPDKPPVILGAGVTVGHMAMLHGCTVEEGALVGIGAVVLDGAVIGKQALVGAKALVPAGMNVPPRSLVLGIPGKIARTLTEEELTRLTIGAAHYVFNAQEYIHALGEGPRE